MDGLFPARAFTSFGPHTLAPSIQMPPLVRLTARRASALRAKVREHCPRRPGVYGMLNPRHELVYVGKAKSLRSRLLSYFRPRSRDPKAGRILQHVETLVWEYAPSEFAALLRELELIRRWQPRFNVQGQPGRRRPTYVCVGRRPAPYVFLARQPPSGVMAAFGPVPAGWRAREAVRRLNDWYRLRDCPQGQEMVFAEQGELFPIIRAAGCLRFEIGTCSGPCLAATTRSAYAEQIRAVLDFLEGTDRAPMESLDQQMAAASAALEFERAAALLERRELLSWLAERLAHVRRAREAQSFIYPVAGHQGDDRWYVIRQGSAVACLPAPRTATERQAALRVARKALEPGHSHPRALPADQIDSVFLVASWFRRYPEERERVLAPDGLSPCARATG